MILTYLIVWIPLILLILFQTNASNQRIARQTQTEMEQQLRQTADEFAAILSSYTTNSITLGNTRCLRARAMLSDMESVRQGLEFLKSAVVYDRYSHDVFLYYNTEVAYSLKGYTTLSVYLKDYLKLNTPQAAARMLSEETSRAVPYWAGQDSGYLLIHCYHQNPSSVNYVLPFSGLRGILSRLASANIDYIELEFSGGERLLYACADGIRLVSREEGEGLDRTRYDQMERGFGGDPIFLRIYYQDAALYSDAHHLQRQNILLMALGAILSLCAAYLLSRQQLRRIRQLEETLSAAVISPDTKLHLPRKWDEYSGVRAILEQVQEKYSDLSDSRRLYQALLRQQTMKLLLHHLFPDQKELMHMLESGNAVLNEEYFCLGCVVWPKGGELPGEIGQMFESGLCCEENAAGMKVFCFLMELPNMDSDSALRGHLADRIRACHAPDAQEEILFSPVFRDIGLFHYAWQEMQQRIAHESDQSEDSQRMLSGESTDPSRIAPFLSAFKKGVMQEARCLLDQFCQYVEALAVSPSEKNTLRYDLLHQMMMLIHREMPERENDMQQRLEKINYLNGREFQAQMRILLQALGEETGSDAFVKAVEFIHANYQDYNLSADQVAEYGGFNKTYLSRLFKAHTNQSYIEYLTQVRMEKAHDLLLHTNLGVHEIVLQIGYLDDSSFRRKFRNMYGLSTSEFRQQYRGDGGPEEEGAEA